MFRPARVLLLAALAAALLSACNNQKPKATATAGSDTVQLDPGAAPATPAADAPAALTGFSHEKGADLFGYYLAIQEVKVGKWKLVALSLGSETEFAQWESGARTSTYSPVMFEFEDETSPMQTNELGQEVRTTRVRVLASAYKVAAGEIHFVGSDAALGEVKFDGTISSAALAELKKGGPGGSNAPVMSGDLSVGKTAFPNTQFSWFGGD